MVKLIIIMGALILFMAFLGSALTGYFIDFAIGAEYLLNGIEFLVQFFIPIFDVVPFTLLVFILFLIVYFILKKILFNKGGK